MCIIHTHTQKFSYYTIENRAKKKVQSFKNISDHTLAASTVLWVVNILWRISSKITFYAFLYFSISWLDSVFDWKWYPPIHFWHGCYQNKAVMTKKIQASQGQTMQRTGQEEVRFNLFSAAVYPTIYERYKDSFTLATKTISIGENFHGTTGGLMNHLHEVLWVQGI